MSGTLNVDLSGVETDSRDFPDGPVEAEVSSATLEVSTKGNPMIKMYLKIFHPQHGTASVRDHLVPAFPPKVAKFVQAFNGLTNEEMKEYQNIDLNPAELVGGRLIVVLGTNDEGWKELVRPWYYPETATEVLEYMQEPVL